LALAGTPFLLTLGRAFTLLSLGRAFALTPGLCFWRLLGRHRASVFEALLAFLILLFPFARLLTLRI
jgi:hypothetical protein